MVLGVSRKAGTSLTSRRTPYGLVICPSFARILTRAFNCTTVDSGWRRLGLTCLDSRSAFAAALLSPTGRNAIAQGSALGKKGWRRTSPDRAEYQTYFAPL